jgi:hypothetical protein
MTSASSSNQPSDSLVSNKTLSETYVDDEFILYSFVLTLISILSFYPIIYLLKKQAASNSKLGIRKFDQTLIYGIMGMILVHFFSEQNCLMQWSFIPLKNWHKLINVMLLIEQCSVVLYMGRVSNSISKDLEDTLFGINLILVLIMQEKDQVYGEIKYSLLPVILNNCYVIYSNISSVKTMVETANTVNREAAIYSIGLYFMSWGGYYMME